MAKAGTPATSDVEEALHAKAEEYVALLLGLVNSLPKPHPPSLALDEADLTGDTEPAHAPPTLSEGTRLARMQAMNAC